MLSAPIHEAVQQRLLHFWFSAHDPESFSCGLPDDYPFVVRVEVEDPIGGR